MTRPLDWTAATEAARSIAAGWAGPGGCIVLFDANGVRASAAGGLASLEHAIPFTPDTPTRYASISKHILTACLLHEGVALDQTLGSLLPGLPEAIGAVPLLRALDMTGGLPDMMELSWQRGVPFTASQSRAEIAATLAAVDALCAAPGKEMAYSNTGWRLGQAVLEARSNEPYAQVLRRLLPAYADTGIVFPDDETQPVPDLATGYWRDGNDWSRGRYGMHFSASGGLAGSGADLARWGAALLAGKRLAAGLLDTLLQPRHFSDGAPSTYRLGLVHTTLGAMRLAGHGGSLPGYRNHFLLAPDQGVGAVLLMNRDEDALLPALRVMAALLHEPAPAAVQGLAPGLFAAADGPDWAELHDGAIEFMGAREALLAEDGRLRSIPSTLAVDVVYDGETLTGRIGGVPRTLHRVPAGTLLDPALCGVWREPGAATVLLIRPDGTARWPWPGAACLETTLTPLPGARALASLPHLMWRHRPCLWLQPDGTLRVASHRARILRLVREA